MVPLSVKLSVTVLLAPKMHVHAVNAWSSAFFSFGKVRPYSQFHHGWSVKVKITAHGSSHMAHQVLVGEKGNHALLPVQHTHAGPFRTVKICSSMVGLSFIKAQLTLAGKSCVI